MIENNGDWSASKNNKARLASELHCWYFISLPFLGIMWKSGRFKVRAYWMIVAWVIFDILGIILGGGDTAYWAHIGGFATGLLAGRPLERTNYDLNELAAMPLPATAAGFQAGQKIVRPPRFSIKSKQPQPVSTPVLQDPKPAFHVTNAIPKGNDLMIFFINEGDPIQHISVVSPVGVVQPGVKLDRREMGTIRLSNLAQQELSNLDLSTSYLAGSEKTTKRLLYEEATKKFTVE